MLLSPTFYSGIEFRLFLTFLINHFKKSIFKSLSEYVMFTSQERQ